MRQKSGPEKQPAEQVVKDIRRATRRQFSAEEKIRIVLEGLRGEESIAELCRREGIASSMYYGWSKDFLEAGKKRLAGDTARAATSDEVKDLRREAGALKEVVAEQALELRLLKKSMIGEASARHRPGPPIDRARSLTGRMLTIAGRLVRRAVKRDRFRLTHYAVLVLEGPRRAGNVGGNHRLWPAGCRCSVGTKQPQASRPAPSAGFAGAAPRSRREGTRSWRPCSRICHGHPPGATGSGRRSRTARSEMFRSVAASGWLTFGKFAEGSKSVRSP